MNAREVPTIKIWKLTDAIKQEKKHHNFDRVKVRHIFDCKMCVCKM